MCCYFFLPSFFNFGFCILIFSWSVLPHVQSLWCPNAHRSSVLLHCVFSVCLGLQYPPGFPSPPPPSREPGSVIKRAEKIRSVQRSQALYARRQETSQAFASKEVEVNPNLVPVGRKAALEVLALSPPP